MHYFKFNIKDYHYATMHLNFTRQGAYLHLLCKYYETERPLPSNLDDVAELCMAKNEGEINAIKYVLENFFTKTEDGYIQKRAQLEIEAYQAEGQRKSKVSRDYQASKRKKSEQKDDVNLTSSTKQETETNKYETVYTSEKFLEFWDVWPKSKRKQSKPACFRKWKESKLDMIADKVIEHVKVCKESSQWKEGYEPAPLTYLNQGRYEDEVEVEESWTRRLTA